MVGINVTPANIHDQRGGRKVIRQIMIASWLTKFRHPNKLGENFQYNYEE
jgi:hypothetical protein